MGYVARLRHLTDDQVRASYRALCAALDRACDATQPPAIRKQRGNLRKRLWRIEAECDRRHMKFSA